MSRSEFIKQETARIHENTLRILKIYFAKRRKNRFKFQKQKSMENKDEN